VSKGSIKIAADRRADLSLDKLATELGFTTKNVLLRVIANELAYCPPRFFFKAVGQLSQYCQRRKK
jgi:hypothetical protein